MGLGRYQARKKGALQTEVYTEPLGLERPEVFWCEHPLSLHYLFEALLFTGR